MPPANTGTKRRNSRSHQAIMDAALHLLQERGYLAVTIEGIAAAAGAGKQTIYRWWPSKAALYLELYKSLLPEEFLDVDCGSFREDLMELLDRLFGVYRETGIDSALSGLIAEMGRQDDQAQALRQQFVLERKPILEKISLRAIKRGELEYSVNPSFIAEIITGTIWFRLLLRDQPLDSKFARDITNHIYGSFTHD